MEYNKKEQLFDKINGLMITDPNLKETWFNWGVKDSYERVEMFFSKELVPEVPQDVADWYETYKDQFEFNLWNYIYDYERNDNSYFKTWINSPNVDALKILVNMHQFGYTVKKEKKYLVKMKGITISPSYLKYNTKSDNWFLGGCEETLPYRTNHTRKQLEEAGFNWVFDCTVFEVKEVI